MGSVRARRTFGVVAVAMLALFAVQVAFADVADPRKQPLDRPTAVDTARAKASLIRLSDLVKGFQVETRMVRAAHVPTCANYPGDRSDITRTGFARSSFIANGNSIASSALFFKTWADADRYWSKTVRLEYIKCLAAQLAFGPRDASAYKPPILEAKRIPMGATGADRAVAYRLIARMARPGETPYLYAETAAFVRKGRGVAIIRIVYNGYLCECHTDIARDLAIRLNDAMRLQLADPTRVGGCRPRGHPGRATPIRYGSREHRQRNVSAANRLDADGAASDL